MPIPTEETNESLIVCENSQGVGIRATLLRMTRYVASFEVYNPYSILQLSEVLTAFKIVIDGKTIYSGRGIINSIDAKNGQTVLNAQVPLAEMFGYATAIRSLSKGRASYSMEPLNFEQVPNSVLTGILEAAAKKPAARS